MFIIGGGTSLENVLNDEHLKRKLTSKQSIGCNKGAIPFDSEIMAFMDQPFALRHYDIISQFHQKGGAVYAPSFSIKPHGLDFINYVTTCPSPRASFETGIFYGNNTGVFALCLAVAMGETEIYLCGMDCRYNREMTKAHFHEGYGAPVNNEDVYTTMAGYFLDAGQYITKTFREVKLFNVANDIEDSLVDLDELYFKRTSYENALQE